MAQETQSANKSGWISEGVWLAIFPVIGYALAFTYEFGYLHHYDVPADLITVELSRILVATGAALGVLGILYLWFNIPYMLFSGLPIHDPIWRCVLRTLPFVVIITVLWITYGNQARYYRWVGLWLIFVVFLEFVFPLLTQYKTKGYRAKLIAQEEHERKIHTICEGVVRRTATRHGLSPFLLLGVVFLMFLAAFSSGHAYALRREIYPTYPE